MSETITAPATVALATLPAIGQPLEGGLFAGLTTKRDGTHCAVVLLDERPAERLSWPDAMAWAAERGVYLPSRPVAALLFANLREQFEKAWHWTGEQLLEHRLHLRLNPRKTILQPVDRGIDFVGQVIRPHHRSTRSRTLTSALQRVHREPADQVHASVNSYFGLLRQATHSHADRARLANAARRRGHCVNGALTKAYP